MSQSDAGLGGRFVGYSKGDLQGVMGPSKCLLLPQACLHLLASFRAQSLCLCRGLPALWLEPHVALTSPEEMPKQARCSWKNGVISTYC